MSRDRSKPRTSASGLRADPPPADPWELFAAWYREAEGAMRYPHAATLATVEGEGGADARVVLVHRWRSDGLLLATDRRSPKARQLESGRTAALVFYWEPLERQVRFRGRVEAASENEADLCFDERPRGSRITAWASTQSRPLASRDELEAAWSAAAERFESVDPIPRPPDWPAYRLIPHEIELWQAAAHRLHDRLLYRATAEGWSVERLWP